MLDEGGGVEPDSEQPQSFADRIQQSIDNRESCLVVGLDPSLERLPPDVFGHSGRLEPGAPGWTGHASVAVALFLERVIEAVAPFAAAVKPNAGFFERLGAAGWDALRRVTEIAQRHDLPVILDAKRGDIGNTASAYADGLLGDQPDTLGPTSDALTLSPYLGRDSIEPFLERVRVGGKGLFLLVRTSNPSGADFQELPVDGEPLYLHVARRVAEWGAGLEGASGLNPVGAVVGATAPETAARIRGALPTALFLVPGYGAQGGGAAELRPFFTPGGRGVLVNASRSILFAGETDRQGSWQSAVARAAEAARDDLEAVRGSC